MRHIASQTSCVLAILVLMLSIIGSGTALSAEGRRLALVIGNTRYSQLPILPNASRDASAIADKLASASLRFEVTKHMDMGGEDLWEGIIKFAHAAAEPDVEAVFVYYSGHGIEAGGRAVLLPTDSPDWDAIRLDRASSQPKIGVLLDDVIRVIRSKFKKTMLVFHDACRNELGRGLDMRSTRMFDENLGVVYSVSRSQPFANDRATGGFGFESKHSPFAAALLKLLHGQRKVSDLLTALANEVPKAEVRVRQEPDISAIGSVALAFSFGSVADDASLPGKMALGLPPVAGRPADRGKFKKRAVLQWRPTCGVMFYRDPVTKECRDKRLEAHDDAGRTGN